MKKQIIMLWISLLSVVFLLLSYGCAGNIVAFKISFEVDGTIFHTIETKGQDIIKLPDDPTKEGYTFDGWFWDKDNWEQPFTANSLMDTPLSSNMTVYAKWVTVDKAADSTQEEIEEQQAEPQINTEENGHQIKINGFEKINEREYRITLAYSAETLYLTQYVCVPDGTTWSIAGDISAINTIPSKVVSLSPGENLYYVLATPQKGEPELYTLHLYRKHLFEVCFITNGGSSVDSQFVEEGSFAVPPSTTLIGYSFIKWDYDFSTPIMKNETISAEWQANTDTQYKVEYYLENLEDNNYALAETVHLTGTTDANVNAEIKDITHFTFNAQLSRDTGTLWGDGSLVLQLFYTRNKYWFLGLNKNLRAGSISMRSQTIHGELLDTDGDFICYESKYGTPLSFCAAPNSGYVHIGWYSVSDDLSRVSLFDYSVTRDALCEIISAPSFVGWSENKTKVSDALDYSFVLSGNTILGSEWQACTNTPYKVEYYIENLDDENYSLAEAVDMTGITDTLVSATIKQFDHFTFNEDTSMLNGNLKGDGTLSLKLYYARDRYAFSSNNSNEKGGEISCTMDGCYKYGKKVTLVAQENPGYSFVGWFDGEITITMLKEIEFELSDNTFFTAFWIAQTDTPYKVKYYLENHDNNEYSLEETVDLTGTTDTNAIAEIKPFEHFIYDETLSRVEGNIAGDKSLILCVYYKMERFLVKIVAESGGNVSVQNGFNGYCKYGSELNIKPTAQFNNALGCEWAGWYSNGVLISDNTSIDINTTIDRDLVITAMSRPKEEMRLFSFKSTPTSCFIRDVWDKTIESLIIPDYVTQIYGGALAGCFSLKELTIPFVGSSEYCTVSNYTSRFGYIFGEKEFGRGYDYSKATRVYESYYDYSTSKWVSREYYLPTSLSHITVTGGPILSYSFKSCTMINSITVGEKVQSVGSHAFVGCDSLEYKEYDNGLYLGNEHNPYMVLIKAKSEDISQISIHENAKIIAGAAFLQCTKLKEITVPDAVENIGEAAFAGCSGLETMVLPFVGSDKNPTIISEKTVFGYIFGTLLDGIYDGFEDVYQCYYANAATNTTYDYHARIPFALKSVTIQHGNLLRGAFYGCYMIKTYTFSDELKFVGENAFFGANSITVYYEGDSESWSQIQGVNNIIKVCENLYICG